MRILLVLLALLVATSGCFGAGPADDPGAAAAPDKALCSKSWQELGDLAFDEHDHTNREEHTAVSCGLDLLAHSTLSADGKSLGEYTEADVSDTLLAVAVTTGVGEDVRVVLLERAALPALRIVGQFDVPGAYGDVKFDKELPLVYVPYPGPKTQADPQVYGFSIWDISDPAKARMLGTSPGAGCHMINTLRIGGESYVWCAAVPGDVVYRIQRLPTGETTGIPLGDATPQSDPELQRYATYYGAISPLGPALLFTPHDMTAQLDPLTGSPILVSAHELQGIRIFDVSDPTTPLEVSAWRGESSEAPIDRVHTAALTKIGDRRIGFGATETFTHTTPKLYVVDFTDYANPHLLAEWNPPGVADDQGLTYSLHNFQVVGTRLYIANFHAGMWVLDVSDPSNPAPIALRTPVRDTSYPRPDEVIVGLHMDINWFWDPVVADGYLLGTDMSAGIELMHVDGDPAGDKTWTGFL